MIILHFIIPLLIIIFCMVHICYPRIIIKVILAMLTGCMLFGHILFDPNPLLTSMWLFDFFLWL